MTTSSRSYGGNLPVKVQVTSEPDTEHAVGSNGVPNLDSLPAEKYAEVALTPVGRVSVIVTGVLSPSTASSPRLVAETTTVPLPPDASTVGLEPTFTCHQGAGTSADAAVATTPNTTATTINALAMPPLAWHDPCLRACRLASMRSANSLGAVIGSTSGRVRPVYLFQASPWTRTAYAPCGRMPAAAFVSSFCGTPGERARAPARASPASRQLRPMR